MPQGGGNGGSMGGGYGGYGYAGIGPGGPGGYARGPMTEEEKKKLMSATTTAEKKPSREDLIYGQIDTMLGQKQDNPFLTGIQSWTTKVLDPNYSAMTQDQMNSEYTTRANDLINNSFIPNENRQLTRMGANAYTGTGKRYWQDKIVNPENTMLANLKGDIANRNFETTQANKSQALSVAPTMTSLLSSIQNMPLENKMKWAQILQGDKSIQAGISANRANAKAQSDNGIGQLIGGLLGSFL